MTDNRAAAPGWHLGPLVGFDIETTGINLEQDRVVTAAIIETAADGSQRTRRTWLVNPGVGIPPEAVAIHGISTELAVADGIPAPVAVAEITDLLEQVLQSGTPLVIMNAPFDLTILDRECRRYGVVPLSERLDTVAPVIDPLILDRHIDRYRRGKRTLEALCAHYGVPYDGSHEASADAVAAAAVARGIGHAAAHVAALSPRELHELQVTAAAQQAESLAAFLRRKGLSPERVTRAWPLVPVPGTQPKLI
ncbi:MAG UNVERIFIED_CONTAM: 3'-5' exonuclease [Thermobifida fusca]